MGEERVFRTHNFLESRPESNLKKRGKGTSPKEKKRDNPYSKKKIR